MQAIRAFPGSFLNAAQGLHRPSCDVKNKKTILGTAYNISHTRRSDSNDDETHIINYWVSIHHHDWAVWTLPWLP